MKRVRIVLALLLVTVLLSGFGLTALAQGPTGTWASGVQIQNNGTTTATVTIYFYWAAGTADEGQLAATHTVPAIGPGKSVVLYIPAHVPGVPDDFVGSAVVEADQPVAAILNTQEVIDPGFTEPTRLGSATGILEPSTTAYSPYLRANYYSRFNSYMAVQNTSSSPADVVVRYFDHTGAELTAAQETATLPAYTSKIFYQDENPSLPASEAWHGDNFHGSAKVTGTAPIAVVVNNADDGASAAQSGFESYNGQFEGATKQYLPKQTVNYYDYQSSFTAQNIGSVAATMTVTFTFGASTYTKTSGVIQPNQSWPVYLAAEGQSGLPTGFSGSGSAVITSDQPMVGIVTESNPNLGYSVIWNAIGEGTGTDTLLFPKCDRAYYDFNGGVTVQNLGTVATTVRCTFSGGGQPTDLTYDLGPIAPGASDWFYAPMIPGLVDWFHGSVVCVSLESQPIAGVYTSRNDVRTGGGDTYSAYNGIQK